MFGIRQENYNFDCADFPTFEDFLNFQTWDHLDAAVTKEFYRRSSYDPIYHSSLINQLKHQFCGVHQVKQNYSQSWQDFFVLTMLNGRKGTYLELGASNAQYMNNTFLLEQLGWQGLSIDFRAEVKPEWDTLRPSSNFKLCNALEINFEDLLYDMPSQIDYLQVDLDSTASLQALARLPHHKHRFSTITFETDVFDNNQQLQLDSRNYLKNLGYELLIDNIAVNNYATSTWEPFEDWYVDPRVIDSALIEKFRQVDNTIKLPHNIFVNHYVNGSSKTS
jgi:hypothetical protein